MLSVSFKANAAAFILSLLVLGMPASSRADKIIKADGGIVAGQILGMSNGQVQIKLDSGTLSFPLAQIKGIDMETPAALVDLKKSASPSPDRVVAVTEPLVNAYKGLPADWVVDAMTLLAGAYADQSNYPKSSALLDEMGQLYGTQGNYSLDAKIVMAKNSLRQGKPDDVPALLDPILQKSREGLAHSDHENRLFGEAYLVQGDALAAKGDNSAALAAYLTTVAVFYGNDAMASAAQARADKLRAADPKLKVP